ncbi:MAG TPA: hypothetical protein VFW94_18590 [Candidatus Acidoferrales bacterium]|nr:hypothetical protein [Candidatus Acidoferrales bacterium]
MSGIPIARPGHLLVVFTIACAASGQVLGALRQLNGLNSNQEFDLPQGLKPTSYELRFARFLSFLGATKDRSFARTSWVILGAIAAGLCLFPSCNDIINYPAPVIATTKPLNPSTVQAGSTTFTLAVSGSKLTPASTVLWNGSPLRTFFISVNELDAVVPDFNVASPGSAAINIETPQPGGGVSSSAIFTITPPPTPVPTVTSLSPSTVTAGGAAFELIITGTNFVNASVITVNGDNRATGFLSTTSLVTQIQPSDITTAGTVQIVVENPPGGSSGPGGSSTPMSLIVKNPVPTIASLSPTSLAAGTTAPTAVTITGSSFVPNSVVQIDGAATSDQISFGGTTQLGISFTAGDMAAAAVHRIQVVNPGPGGGVSNVLILPVNPTIAHGLPVLLDYGFDGSQANQGLCGTNCETGPPTLTTAGPSMTSDGKIVVFASTSTNLLKNQANTGSDVFARTTCLSSASCTPTTTDVSVGPNGEPSNGSSWGPAVDSSGSHVAFTSTASNLVAGVSLAPGSEQVYWMPICEASGITSNCSAGQLVSIAPDDITPGNGNSYDAAISPDGRYVAFVSLATNLVANVGNLDGRTPQVFVRDTCNGVVGSSTTGGCTPTTYLVSTPDGTTPGNDASSQPSISSNGQYISFSSVATNLGATAPNPNGTQQIFQRTTCLPTNAICAAVTTLISTPDGVTPANATSSESQIAGGGRFIVFASTATNLVVGAGPVQQVYMYDTCLNATSCVPGLTLVSTPDGSTPGNGPSEYPTISLGSATVTTSTTTGEFVAFASRASNLASNTSNGISNVFVRKSCVGFSSSVSNCTPTTALATQGAGTSPPPANGDSLMPWISADSHTVTFISAANNLVANDTNGFYNLFLGLTSF